MKPMELKNMKNQNVVNTQSSNTDAVISASTSFKRKKTAFAAALICTQALAVSAPVYAADSPTNEEHTGTYWGIGIGTALGAIIGGPVGAAAGAALGGSVGYGQDKDSALEQTEVKLDTQVMSLSALEGELKKSNTQLEALRAQTRKLQRANALKSAELADLKAQEVTEREEAEILAGIAKHYSQEVYYRHNESSIPDYAKQRMDELVNFMVEHPSINISLQGHSDLIGPENANLALTQARVDAIRDYLIDQGVDAARINAQAHGEAFATVMAGDASNYILDRRVAIELSIPDSETPSAVAKQPTVTLPLAINVGGR
jgi:outer membrane protein OmpA-like peptidoglycan-associated protein